MERPSGLPRAELLALEKVLEVRSRMPDIRGDSKPRLDPNKLGARLEDGSETAAVRHFLGIRPGKLIGTHPSSILPRGEINPFELADAGIIISQSGILPPFETFLAGAIGPWLTARFLKAQEAQKAADAMWSGQRLFPPDEVTTIHGRSNTRGRDRITTASKQDDRSGEPHIDQAVAVAKLINSSEPLDISLPRLFEIFSALEWAIVSDPQPKTPELEQVDNLFSRHFHTTGTWKHGNCHEDIKNLLDVLLQSPVFDRSKAKVLVIYKRASQYEAPELIHARLRDEITGIFLFHVVIEYEGYIYDLSYGNEPTVAPAASYFEKMYYHEQKISKINIPELDDTERKVSLLVANNHRFRDRRKLLTDIIIGHMTVDRYLDQGYADLQSHIGSPRFFREDFPARYPVSTLASFLGIPLKFNP